MTSVSRKEEAISSVVLKLCELAKTGQLKICKTHKFKVSEFHFFYGSDENFPASSHYIFKDTLLIRCNVMEALISEGFIEVDAISLMGLT